MTNKFNLSQYPLFGFFKHLPDKEKKEYTERMFNLISDSTMDRVYQRFDEKKQKEMLELFNKKGLEKQKKAFLDKHVPDFESIFMEESLKLKEKIESQMKR